MSTDFIVEDSRVTFEATIKDANTKAVKNITGHTVKLRYFFEGVSTVIVTKTATITDAANGVVEYQMAVSELKSGTMVREWEVTDALSKVYIGGEKFISTVRPKLTV